MPPKDEQTLSEVFESFLTSEVTHRDEQVQELQESLADERDKRLEDRFIFIVVVTVLLDVVFFSVLDNLGGPLALLILELLILVPLARRMGMEEIAQLMDRVLNRMAGSMNNKED